VLDKSAEFDTNPFEFSWRMRQLHRQTPGAQTDVAVAIVA